MDIQYMVIGGYGQVGSYVCQYLKALDRKWFDLLLLEWSE